MHWNSFSRLWLSSTQPPLLRRQESGPARGTAESSQRVPMCKGSVQCISVRTHFVDSKNLPKIALKFDNKKVESWAQEIWPRRDLLVHVCPETSPLHSRPLLSSPLHSSRTSHILELQRFIYFESLKAAPCPKLTTALQERTFAARWLPPRGRRLNLRRRTVLDGHTAKQKRTTNLRTPLSKWNPH